MAKRGMAALGYDPENGYVENFMFGGRIELHSGVMDMWAAASIPGGLLLLLIAGMALTAMMRDLGRLKATPWLFFAALIVVQNVFVGRGRCCPPICRSYWGQPSCNLPCARPPSWASTTSRLTCRRTSPPTPLRRNPLSRRDPSALLEGGDPLAKGCAYCMNLRPPMEYTRPSSSIPDLRAVLSRTSGIPSAKHRSEFEPRAFSGRTRGGRRLRRWPPGCRGHGPAAEPP